VATGGAGASCSGVASAISDVLSLGVL